MTSDIKRTALALYALKSVNFSDTTLIGQSLNYLTSNQNADGGWGFTSGDASNNYVTATVIRTLSAYNSVFINQNAINKAASYLLTKQNQDGGFGSSPSTVYDTALSVISLIQSGGGATQNLRNAINYLTTTQFADGSWNEDPYSTALALQALAAARPNLTVTNITLSKPMPPENETVTITANVNNTGLDNASNVIVRFYLGDPAAGGTQIGSDQITASLPLGTSAQASITQSFTGTGGKTIFVVADPDGLISETSESDNKTSTRIWIATAPDLAVYSEDLKPSTYVPASGAAFTLAYTVRNLGESPSDAFDVALYDGDPSAGGTLLQTAHISGLNGTEVRTGTFGVTLTGDGAHTLYLAADSGNAVAEISETNNTGTVTIQIGGVQAMADLAVTPADITLNPSRPTSGQTVRISATVRNQGTEAANNFTVEIFDGAPAAGGTLINSRTLSLAAGAEQTVTADWTISNGIHDIYLIVDRTNQINETNETNNQTSVRTMPDMVDISISATDLAFTPSHPVNSDAVLLSISVHNTGIKDTGPFNLALYDGDPASGGALLRTFPISNIAGDGDTTVSYTFTAVPWTYRFYAMADTENTVAELNEDNNLAIRSLKIKAPGEVLGPDLVPVKIDLSGTATDPQTLAITGTAQVTFQNKGDDKITNSFDVLVFEDTDLDGVYTPGIDNVLGTATNSTSLWPEGAGMAGVALSGAVKFLNAPVYALIDPSDAVREQDETNNLLNSCKDCEKRPENPIEPVLKWKWQQPSMQMFNWIGAIQSPPAIVNLTDDNHDGKIDDQDIPSIVFNMRHEDNYKLIEATYGRVRAFRGDTGSVIFSLYNAAHPTLNGTNVAAADINHDGMTEFVAVRDPGHYAYGSNKYQVGLVAYRHDGTLLWDNLDQVKNWNATHAWEYRMYPAGGNISIADIDGDGNPEIMTQSAVFNADGSPRCVRNRSLNTGRGDPYAATILADLDMDGVQEIIAGNTAYNADCSVKWFNQGLPDGRVAVGNFDGDPYPEIVLLTKFANYLGGGGKLRLYLLEHDGTVKWGPVIISPPDMISYNYPFESPVIADFDGDGKPEIGVRALDKYYLVDSAGAIKKSWTMPMNSSTDLTPTAPAVFDLNGDGRPEVMFTYDSPGHFSIFDGTTGALLFSEPFNATSYEQEVYIADVDGDNHAEIVAFGHDNSTRDAIRVYGSKNNEWVPARKIWNQAAYHVTNINDDGTVPQQEPPSWLLNNTYLTQTPVGSSTSPYRTPNLTASYLRSRQNGASLDVTVRIGNGGAKEAAPGASVAFYSGSSTGTLLGTVYTIKTLQPGEYEDITYNIGSAYAGTSAITAVVDQTDNVSECREDDNQASMSLSTVSGLTDLSVGADDLTLSPGPYYEGSPVTVTAEIANAGYYAAANIAVKLYDGNPGSGTQIGSAQTISSIDGGGSAAVSFTFDTLGKGGTHVLYVVVDGENAIAETNETNNVASITIDVQQPILPNLAITANDIALSSSSLTEGTLLTVSATVLNRGASVSNIPVRINFGSNSQTRTIYSGLSLGQTATIQATFETVGLTGGQTVLVEVDPENSISESIETDNSASKPVLIQPSGLKTSLAADKTQYNANSDVQINYTVKNNNSQVWTGTGAVTVEDTSGNLLATAATFTVQNLKPMGLSEWSYRIPATLTPGWNLTDGLAAATIDFASALSALGVPAATVDKNSIRVLELDSAGNLIGEKQTQAKFKTDSTAAITWLVDGTTLRNVTRYFALYFDTTDHGQKQPSSNTQLPGKLIAFSDNAGNIYTVMGKSDGTFGTAMKIDDLTAYPDNTSGIVLDDFDNDGFADIITGSGYNGKFYLYRNKADGTNTFNAKTEIGSMATGWVMDMASADFNNDGFKDFVVSGDNKNLYLFTGNANGTFTKTALSAPSDAKYLRGKTAADVDNDGKIDLIIANYTNGAVYFYKSRGDGTFLPPVRIGTSGNEPCGVAAGDFDGDAKIDLIVNTGSGGETNFFKGKGDGTFASPIPVPSLDTNNWAAFDTADFNNDGQLDIIAATHSTKTILYYPGSGNGTFGAKSTIGTTSYTTLGISASRAAEAQPVLGNPETVPGQTFQFTWNTGTATPGQYQVHVKLSDAAATVADNTAHFEILPDMRTAAQVVTDKISYNPNDTATITSTITNQSANYIFENLSAKLTLGSDGTYTETKTIRTLMPGALYAFKSYWHTATNAAGTYPVTLELKDATGSVIASSTANIKILSSSQTGAGIVGAVTASPNFVYQGRDETINYTVTNSGNEDIAGITRTIIIADPQTGEAKATVTREGAGVKTGETISDLVSVPTLSLQPRTYMAVLQVKTDSMTTPKTLASALFEVKPGIEVTKTIPDIKNILVWVNENCAEQGAEGIEHSAEGIGQGAGNGGNTVASVQNCTSLDMLRQALSEAGAAYRIVSDKKDFQNELRNPIYTDFMILGDQQPLEDHYAEELREQVYAGKGLVSSLFNREDLSKDLFGITFRGGLPGKDYPVELGESSLGIRGSFPSYGKAVRVEAEKPDDVIGTITETSGKQSVSYPAIIMHEYGRGKTLFFAFDLGMSSKTPTAFSLLFRQALGFIHAPLDTDAVHPDQLIPVAFTVKSLGAPFSVRITETYPDALRILECGAQDNGSAGEEDKVCAWIADNPWVQTAELASNETATILYYVRMPDQAGSYTLETEAGYLENGTYTPYQTLSTELKVGKNAATMLGDALTELQNMALAGHEASAQRNAIRYLNTVRNRQVLSQKDREAAIADLEQAVGEMFRITSADVTNARQAIGRLLLYWEAECYFHQNGLTEKE